VRIKKGRSQNTALEEKVKGKNNDRPKKRKQKVPGPHKGGLLQKNREKGGKKMGEERPHYTLVKLDARKGERLGGKFDRSDGGQDQCLCKKVVSRRRGSELS